MEVELALDFGAKSSVKGYRCRILELQGNNRLRLERYVQELSLKVNKRFPPVT